jgi:hypothetical protein
MFLRDNTPGRLYRSSWWWAAKFWTWNFNRELQADGWQSYAGVNFLNYWFANVGFRLTRRLLDDRLTRGGPSAIAPGSGNVSSYFSTDNRKWLQIQANGAYSWNDEHGSSYFESLSVNLKPSSSLTISTGPQWNRTFTAAQYVDTFDDETAAQTFGHRYVFGKLDQSQLTMTTRVNYIITPRVSLQIFAQPLISSGDYSHLKEFAAPRTYDFREYGVDTGSIALDRVSNEYTVDPDTVSGPARSFTFDNPDFNLKSLRVNAVFRWELKPGSTFYAVWTRKQENTTKTGAFDFGSDARAMLTAPGDDVFLVKMAYWIGR